MFLGVRDEGTKGISRQGKEGEGREARKRTSQWTFPVRHRGDRGRQESSSSAARRLSVLFSSSIKLHCLGEDQISTVWKRANYKTLCRCGELIWLSWFWHKSFYPGSYCLDSCVRNASFSLGFGPNYAGFSSWIFTPEPWKGASSLFKFALKAKFSFRDLHKIKDAFYLLVWLLKKYQRRI